MEDILKNGGQLHKKKSENLYTHGYIFFVSARIYLYGLNLHAPGAPICKEWLIDTLKSLDQSIKKMVLILIGVQTNWVWKIDKVL